MREIDSLIRKGADAADAQLAGERLRSLEGEVASVSVPLSYMGELYHLRLHIAFLQEKLQKRASQIARTGA